MARICLRGRLASAFASLYAAKPLAPSHARRRRRRELGRRRNGGRRWLGDTGSCERAGRRPKLRPMGGCILEGGIRRGRAGAAVRYGPRRTGLVYWLSRLL